MENRKKIKALFIVIAAVFAICSICSISFADSKDPDALGHDREWWNFRNSADNNGVTDRAALTNADTTALKWAARYGTERKSSPTLPIIIDDKLYIGVDNQIICVNKKTGKELKRSDSMPSNVGFGMNSLLYADGKIFCLIEQGQIAAVDINTLQLSWVTERIGGQTLSPLSYKKINGTGYVYTGTWNSETDDGSYVCASTDNSNLTDSTRTINGKTVNVKQKKLTWDFTPARDDSSLAVLPDKDNSKHRGFYWAGAYVNDKYLAVGTDDGSEENQSTSTAVYYSLNPVTGKVIDRIDGIKGDIRSTTVYYKNHLYFSTKGGRLYKAAVSDDGHFSGYSVYELEGETSASPVIYNDRLYIGVCANEGKYDSDATHHFDVIDVSGDLTRNSKIYEIPVKGYPQAPALLSTSHVNEDYNGDGKPDDRVYVYFTYNAPPGGIYYFYDEPGRKSAPSGQGNLYIPESEMQQYCLSSIAEDRDGTIYFKNDSNYLMALERNDAYFNNVQFDQLDKDGNKLSTPVKWNQKFRAGTASYELKAASSAEKVSIKLNLPAGTEARINDNPYDSDGRNVVGLTDPDSNTIAITAIHDKYTRTYKFNITKQSANADLSTLFINQSNSFDSRDKDYKFTTDFKPDQADYQTNILTDRPSFYRLWAEPQSKDASVKVYADNYVGELDKDNSIPARGNDHTYYPIYVKDWKKDITITINVAAENGTNKKTYTVKITRQTKVSGITLNKSSLDLVSGDSTELDIQFTPPDSTDKRVKWASSDDNVVSVTDASETADDGYVSNAKANISAETDGTAIVTAKSEDGSYTASCEINVTSIDTVRNKAIKDLNEYKKDNQYRTKESADKENITNQAVENINSSKSGTDIDSIVTNAKSKIDQLITASDYVNKLKNEAADKSAELSGYKKKDDYRDTQWSEIETILSDTSKDFERIISTASENMDSTDDMDKIDTAASDAKSKIDKVKTDQFLTEVDNSIADLKSYKNKSDYREAEQKQMDSILADAESSLNTASTNMEIRQIVSSAKTSFDALTTNNAYSDTAVKTLNEAKYNALLTLRTYPEKLADSADETIKSAEKYWAENYREAELQERQSIINKYTANIQNAESEQDLPSYLSAAENQLNSLKSSEGYLQDARDEAINRLNQYKESDYRTEQWKKVEQYIRDATDEINQVQTSSDQTAENKIKEITDNAVANIQKVETNLNSTKEESKKRIREYAEKLKEKGTDTYNLAQLEEIDDIVAAAETQINEADDPDSVEEIKNAKIKELDDVKTSSEILSEAKDSAIANIKQRINTLKKSKKYASAQQKEMDTIFSDYSLKIKSSRTAHDVYKYEADAFKALDKVKTAAQITQAKISKAKNTKATITVKIRKSGTTVNWKKVSGVSGYKVYRSDKKSNGYKTIKTYTNNKKFSFADKKIKKKKSKKHRTYYYKVRTYTKINGKTYYGKWSNMKSVKS